MVDMLMPSTTKSQGGVGLPQSLWEGIEVTQVHPIATTSFSITASITTSSSTTAVTSSPEHCGWRVLKTS